MTALLHCPNGTLRNDFPLQVPSTSVNELTLLIALCSKGTVPGEKVKPRLLQTPRSSLHQSRSPRQQSHASPRLEADVCALPGALLKVSTAQTAANSALLLETAKIRRKVLFFHF